MQIQMNQLEQNKNEGFLQGKSTVNQKIEEEKFSYSEKSEDNNLSDDDFQHIIKQNQNQQIQNKTEQNDLSDFGYFQNKSQNENNQEQKEEEDDIFSQNKNSNEEKNEQQKQQQQNELLLQTLPDFCLPQNVKDLNGIKPGQPNYDPSTLQVPLEKIQNMTEYIKQYWEFKSVNYDRILFVRRGRFFDTMFEDAIEIHKILDYNFQMKQLKIGIPAHKIHYAIQKLLLNNRSVAICEQIESEVQQQLRVKQQKQLAKNERDLQVMKRQVTSVHTRGIIPIDFSFILYDAFLNRIIFADIIEDQESKLQKQVNHKNQNKNQEKQIEVEIQNENQNENENEYQKNLVKKIQKIKDLLNFYQPVQEVVYSENLSQDVKEILEHLPQKPLMKKIPNKFWEDFDSDFIQDFIQLMNENGSNIPNFILENYQSQENEIDNNQTNVNSLNLKIRKKIIRQQVFNCFSYYMKKNMLFDKIMSIATYIVCDTNQFIQSQIINNQMKNQNENKMLIDHQTFENLDLFNVSYLNFQAKNIYKYKTVFDFIDFTCTQFGRRNLKNWLLQPLYDSEEIRERQQALIDLENLKGYREQFKVYIREMPDLEKMIQRIYLYTIRQKDIVSYGDISQMRITEMKEVLEQIQRIYTQIFTQFTSNVNKMKGNLLKKLTTEFKEDDSNQKNQNNSKQQQQNQGLLFNMSEKIKQVLESIEWRGPNKEKAVPKKGYVKNYDKQYEKLLQVEQKFLDYLQKVQLFFGNDQRIQYSHSKFEYQLEFPVDVFEKYEKPIDFEITSKRKGYERFYSKELKQIINEFHIQVDRIRDELAEFSMGIFKKFYSFKYYWDSFIEILKQLDCLLALHQVSFGEQYQEIFDQKFVRPVIIDNNLNEKKQNEKNNNNIKEIQKQHQILQNDDIKNFNIEQDNINQVNESFVYLTQAVHPCLVLQGLKMVKNDVILNTQNFQEFNNIVIQKNNEKNSKNEKNPRCAVITGCNMGGKSTIMRTLAINTILAQLGCFVPCKEFYLKPFKKLFTRMGSSDDILQNKSTFYLEMEDAYNIVQNSCQNSLILIDELGRGTAAFDGVALAYGILKYLIEKKKGVILFSTHSHILLNEFQKNENLKQQIQFLKMDSILDETGNQVLFLYELVEGQESLSYAARIMSMLNFSEEIILNSKFNTILLNLQQKIPIKNMEF
ncbi:P-loop containing nucleoside triphosphate hydrolase [Pseudocohnilembus persalinus]|uniref:DNA mismatch repair protein n=1 Tax=Pseudocohnilembus persalinus TaxID=266149 RepID=A0A0V0QI97_PSEPJ|nr:P-loop containing nucleoside triphosphate hydrolase [Pseudocohnilembus persalinus]|eukprot:KRX01945.1 P-loop containing nucleoside triphosphate hydrolase [Pseudocohnilembus persalinus]